MMDSDIAKNVKRHGLRFGLILGAILLVGDLASLFSIAYSRSISVIFLCYFLSSLIVPLVATIVLSKKLRAKIGGFWNLRQATSGIFIMFIVAFLISSLGSFLFIKYINPQIAIAGKHNVTTVLSNFLDKMGADTDKIDETIELVNQQFDAITQFNPAAVIPNLLTSIIILFITALIFAAIFKREQPISTNHDHP